MSRRKIVAGNWKMNLSHKEAVELFDAVAATPKSEIDVFVFPPACFVTELAAKNSINVGTQNAHPKASGAFTGEVSIHQWVELNVKAVLIGHSERRMYFGESNEFLKEKVDAALSVNVQPFFCCGEPLEVREAGKHIEFVKNQLEESVFHLPASEFEKIVIAYEPIWAIGTGLTASVDQAEEMHAAIRSWITEKYGKATAEKISILYGGSCNPGNARALFACPNVDGGLIGGASLKYEDFAVLIDPKTWNI